MVNVFKMVGVMLIALLVSSCAMIKFESVPPGATVTAEDPSLAPVTLGVTPFETRIYDKQGWYSKYTFKATKEGYKPATVEVEEKAVPDGWSFDFFPKTLIFKLEKQ